VPVYRELLPLHPMLGRHVHLDSRSKAYALQPSATPIRSVRHAAHIGILDQGEVGACTGNASTSCAYHEPYFAATSKPWFYVPDEGGALAWYHDNTVADDYAGTYPPDDTGSDGLTSSKVAVKHGIASGYQAALDLASSLAGLMAGPGITGIPFYNSMFDVGSDGLMTVTTSSGLAGGHELCVDEVVLPDALGNGTGDILVGGPNSWGPGWGALGRWYLRASDWWALRKNDGDVYFWTPATQPAPSPAPTPGDPADVALWAATKHWATAERHIVDNAKAAHAVTTWAKAKGLA
jgi:hypothetical protein